MMKTERIPEFKAALFDMDGTLTHTMRYWRLAPLEFAVAHDILLTPEEYSELYLTSSRIIVEKICKKYGIQADPKDVSTELETYVFHHYLHDARLRKDADRFLDLLKEKGIPACIATGSPRENAVILMERLGLTDRFAFIAGGYDYPINKRSPEYFEMMSEKLGVKPRELCVFEDALYSMESAKKAGCSVVAIHEPTQANDMEAIREICDVYAESYTQLCEMM